ncbi:MAG: hypothetical protein VXW11_03565, partial [Pseudomonadota bacterium]|nr:hypothetical protein [Pseudomonadota bacterium]
MLLFLVKRFGVMMFTALVLTFVVFYLTNLYPNLEKLAKTQANNRMTDDQVATWLDDRGYNRPVLARYGEWLGVVPGWTRTDDEGKTTGRCISSKVPGDIAPRFCGVFQGNFGFSSVFKEPVSDIINRRLSLTGILMFWVIKFTIPEISYASTGVILAAFVIGSFAISVTNGGIGVYPISI